MQLLTTKMALPSNAAPLYEKVKQVILEKVRTGEWKAEHKLPGEPELARELKISRMTINRAMRELTSEGVLERIPGVGTFVTSPEPIPAVVHIHNIADEIVERNQQYNCKVIKLESVYAPKSAHEGMALKKKRKLFRSLILHYANNIPAQLEDRYVLPDFAPQYMQQDYTKISTTSYLHNITPPTDAEHLIEAVMPDDTVCKDLEMPREEPCLLVTRRTWVGDVITTYMRMMHPGSRYRLLGRDRS